MKVLARLQLSLDIVIHVHDAEKIDHNLALWTMALSCVHVTATLPSSSSI